MRHALLFKYKVRGAFDFMRRIFHGRIILSPASVSLKTHAAAGVFASGQRSRRCIEVTANKSFSTKKP